MAGVQPKQQQRPGMQQKGRASGTDSDAVRSFFTTVEVVTGFQINSPYFFSSLFFSQMQFPSFFPTLVSVRARFVTLWNLWSPCLIYCLFDWIFVSEAVKWKTIFIRQSHVHTALLYCYSHLALVRVKRNRNWRRWINTIVWDSNSRGELGDGNSNSNSEQGLSHRKGTLNKHSKCNSEAKGNRSQSTFKFSAVIFW